MHTVKPKKKSDASNYLKKIESRHEIKYDIGNLTMSIYTNEISQNYDEEMNKLMGTMKQKLFFPKIK